MTTTTTNTTNTPLALVPHSSEGEQGMLEFLGSLPSEIRAALAIVDEHKTYPEEEFSTLRTIQSQRFEDLLGKMTQAQHTCTSLLGVMLHQAELLGLHQYAPGGPYTLYEWVSRHSNMTKAVFEDAYGLGKAWEILEELGVPQEVLESPQFTKDKATRILRDARDRGRQKKPILERLEAEHLEKTGQKALSPEEERLLEQQAYQEVLVQARADAIDLITNRTDDDLRREQERASGLRDRVPFLISGVTYRRLTNSQVEKLLVQGETLPDTDSTYDEGLGVLTGQLRIYLSDSQVDNLEKSGRYFLTLRWGHEDEPLNAQKLGSKIAQQIADELEALDQS